MLAQLMEAVLPSIIGVMVHKREKLTPKELAAQKSFLEKLNVSKRKTNKPVILAMIGLTGSGKSLVAQEFAKHIGGTVIEGDEIRIGLRKQGGRYDRARALAENIGDGVIIKSHPTLLFEELQKIQQVYYDNKEEAKTKRAKISNEVIITGLQSAR